MPELARICHQFDRRVTRAECARSSWFDTGADPSSDRRTDDQLPARIDRAYHQASGYASTGITYRQRREVNDRVRQGRKRTPAIVYRGEQGGGRRPSFEDHRAVVNPACSSSSRARSVRRWATSTRIPRQILSGAVAVHRGVGRVKRYDLSHVARSSDRSECLCKFTRPTSRSPRRQRPNRPLILHQERRLGLTISTKSEGSDKGASCAGLTGRGVQRGRTPDREGHRRPAPPHGTPADPRLPARTEASPRPSRSQFLPDLSLKVLRSWDRHSASAREWKLRKVYVSAAILDLSTSQQRTEARFHEAQRKTSRTGEEIHESKRPYTCSRFGVQLGDPSLLCRVLAVGHVAVNVDQAADRLAVVSSGGRASTAPSLMVETRAVLMAR